MSAAQVSDTEILDHILQWLKPYVLNLDPIGPLSVKYAVHFIERERKERRTETYTNGTSFSDQTVREFYKTPGPYAVDYKKGGPPVTGAEHWREWRERMSADVLNRAFSDPPTQRFWRCGHHPSAIDNYFDMHPFCEQGCHKSELRWHDNGTCKPPTS